MSKTNVWLSQLRFSMFYIGLFLGALTVGVILILLAFAVLASVLFTLVFGFHALAELLTSS